MKNVKGKQTYIPAVEFNFLNVEVFVKSLEVFVEIFLSAVENVYKENRT